MRSFESPQGGLGRVRFLTQSATEFQISPFLLQFVSVVLSSRVCLCHCCPLQQSGGSTAAATAVLSSLRALLASALLCRSLSLSLLSLFSLFVSLLLSTVSLCTSSPARSSLNSAFGITVCYVPTHKHTYNVVHTARRPPAAGCHGLP